MVITHFNIATILGYLLIASFYYAPTSPVQPTSGIFITIKLENQKETKEFGRKVSTRDRKSNYYIPQQPLISSTEFSSVTAIIPDIKKFASYFYLKISKEGMNKLKAAALTFPESEFVLLIDDNVFGTIGGNKEEDFLIPEIMISGTYLSPDVSWAHQRLTELITSRQP